MQGVRKVSVVGLGYVGLPVAVAFGKAGFSTIGYDIDTRRISSLNDGVDETLEVGDDDLAGCGVLFTSDLQDLASADFHIVTVPTPITADKRPDLEPLCAASRALGSILKRGDIVVYESTVYPGATEEVCVPILEAVSGLALGLDFEVGYSPERINPGDRENRFESIIKVVSASSQEALQIVSETYSSVVTAGIHQARSIKVAEAAKVIENTQRDLNIALVNELALIFDRMDIKTQDVLEAASTKWNFMNFTPGLVGGHCIGVDPYYMTAKAEMLGYHPEVILSGRRTNDTMSNFVVHKLVKLMSEKNISLSGSKIALLGLTFKENVPDIRNSKVLDIYEEIKTYGVTPIVYDPLLQNMDNKISSEINLCSDEDLFGLDAAILAVPHSSILDMGSDFFAKALNEKSVFIDLKSVFAEKDFPSSTYWSL